MVAQRDFRFCIDRGGTFTDIYAEVPGLPGVHVLKLLSVDPENYEDAPREGIRRILEQYSGISIPRSSKIPTDRIDWIRMGTTVATNALLERKGERTALVVTKGFKELLTIGNQARPKIFDLTVARPSPLYEVVVEADERVCLASDGDSDLASHGDDAASPHIPSLVKGISGELVRIVRPLDEENLKPALQSLLDGGIRCLAVVFLHSYTFPYHEQAWQQVYWG